MYVDQSFLQLLLFNNPLKKIVRNNIEEVSGLILYVIFPEKSNKRS
jgi:hypothetical protein